MSETILAVAATAPASTAPDDATTAPVDGAFTALLAAALGGGPAIAAATTRSVGDAPTGTDDGDVPGPVEGDAGADTEDAGTGSTGLAPAAVVATAGAVPAEEGPAATAGVVTPVPAAGTPAGPVTAPLGDGVAPTVTRGPAGPPVIAPATDRAAASPLWTGSEDSASPVAGAVSATSTAPAAVDVTGSGAEAPVRTSPDPGTGTSAAAPVAPATAVATAAASAPAPPGGSDLHARLVARVMDALDVLENAPPPRRLTVDLPDAEGLRLHVSLRGGEVHVSIVGSGSGGDLSGWSRDLTEALAARGFSLGGFGAGTGRDERRQPGNDEGRTPADQPPAPRPRIRPLVADQDLRL